MDIERIAPADLTPETAAGIAEVTNAAMTGLDVLETNGQSWMLACQHDSEARTEGVWVARVDGRIVGWSNIVLFEMENTGTARIGAAVHPGHQRRGIGRALFESAAAATDRPRLTVRAYRGSSGEAMLERCRAQRTVTHAVRRLDLTRANPAWPDLRCQAEEAAADYEVVRRAGPTPPDDLLEMSLLREAINDAPDTDEFEAYPPQRITTYEADLAARRQTPYVVVARHRATGEPAGVSFVVVDEFAPSTAHQEDTSVLPAHRGHRLGTLLKLEMIDWLRAERPEVTSTETWNAEDNDHMIAVNERLGLQVVAHNSRWEIIR